MKEDEVQRAGFAKKDMRALKAALIAGLLYSVNAIAVVYDLITHSLDPQVRLAITLVHVISCLFFFFGFYTVGKLYRNVLLIMSSLLLTAVLPLVNILYVFNIASAGQYVLFLLLCSVLVLFGLGLLKEGLERKRREQALIFKLTGILGLLTAAAYLTLSIPIINIGLVLSLPGNVLMAAILFGEMSRKN